MFSKAQLNSCESLDRLGQLIDGLKGQKVSQSGGRLYSADKHHSIKISDIKKKLIKLHESALQSTSLSRTEVHKRTSELIYKLEQLTDTQHTASSLFSRLFASVDSKMDLLKSECLTELRSDQKAMQAAVESYNKLTEAYSESRGYGTQALHQLAYLRLLLGIAWNSRQKSGKERLPYYEPGAIQGSAPKSLDPSACETLGEVFYLVVELTKKTIADKEEGTIEIPGERNLSVRDIETRLIKLYEAEMEELPLAKTPMRLAFVSTLFALRMLCPTETRSIKKHSDVAMEQVYLDATYHKALDGLRKDNVFMEHVAKDYHRLVHDHNDALLRNRPLEGVPQRSDYLIQYHLKRTLLNAEILDLKVSSAARDGWALFPDAHQAAGVWRLQWDYNSQALLLRHETDLRQKRSRLQDINKKLSPDALGALLLSEEDKKRLQQDRDKLEAALVAELKPMNDALYHSLHSEQVRRLEALGIKDFDEDHLPILGVDIDVPRPWVFSSPAVLPRFFRGTYNPRARMVNATMDRLQRSKKLREYQQAVGYEQMGFPSFAEMEAIGNEMDAIEEMEKSLLSGWDVDHTLERLGHLLIIFPALPDIKLNDAQLRGEEPLPVIDVNTLPVPDPTAVRAGFEQYSEQRREQEVAYWPQHWRGALKPQLEDLWPNWEARLEQDAWLRVDLEQLGPGRSNGAD